MKKLLFIAGLSLSLNYSFSQTANTVPATGNVGLGTTSPTTKLQVCGTAKIDSLLIVKDTLKAMNDLKVDGNVFLSGDLYFTNGIDTGYNFSRVAVFDNNGQLRGGIGSSLAGLIYEYDCIPKTDNNGNIVGYPAPAWKAGGGQNFGVLYTGTSCPAHVGIGTATPVVELEVRGQTKLDGASAVGGNVNPDVAFTINEITYPGPNGGSFSPYILQALGLDTDIKIKSTGETTFEVNTSNYAIAIDNNHANGRGLFIDGGSGSSSSVNYGLIDVRAAGKQIFYVDGKNSTTYAREVKVNLDATWPDYVFEETYERMKPEEKEMYFKENKHLPGIAPASTMEADGIPVSETLNGLTRNVEENSLDINDIYKELKLLKEENEKLKAEIELLKNK